MVDLHAVHANPVARLIYYTMETLVINDPIISVEKSLCSIRSERTASIERSHDQSRGRTYVQEQATLYDFTGNYTPTNPEFSSEPPTREAAPNRRRYPHVEEMKSCQ